MVFSEQQEFPFNLCSLGLVRRGGVGGQQHSFGLDVDEQNKKLQVHRAGPQESLVLWVSVCLPVFGVNTGILW